MDSWDDFFKHMESIILINNMLLLAFFVIFGIVFTVASLNPKSPVHWTDLIVDKKTKLVSIAKIGQFFGLAVSTWVVITLTQTKDSIAVLPMIFPMWLAYIGGSWSYDKYMKSKANGEGEHKRSNDPKDDTK